MRFKEIRVQNLANKKILARANRPNCEKQDSKANLRKDAFQLSKKERPENCVKQVSE